MNARQACTIVAMLAVGGMVACSEPAPPPSPVRPVQLTAVVPGGVADVAVYAGEVRPRYETELGFRIGGKLVARMVDVGARVKAGQVLARLDPADVGLAADAQRAALASTETEYGYAKAELARYQNLFNQKFISASALDQKTNAFKSAEAKYQQQKAQVAVTTNQAGYASLSADHDGIITAVNAEVGQVVAAGQPVVKIARVEERDVVIAVPENRFNELRRAKDVVVVVAADPKKLHPARVREVSPTVDAATRTFTTRVALLDVDPGVQWGMTANVVLRMNDESTDALLPLTALYHAPDGKPAVWVYDPATHKVALRAVTVAQYREDGMLVSAGLAANEQVVSAGVNKLVPGQEVRPYTAVTDTKH